VISHLRNLALCASAPDGSTLAPIVAALAASKSRRLRYDTPVSVIRSSSFD
jgi:hypothetical protein